MHALINAALKHPDLLIEHIRAYGELASAEADELSRSLGNRSLLMGSVLLLCTLTAGLAGGAFMLWVVLGDTLSTTQIIMLCAPGALAGLGTLICLSMARARPATPPFGHLALQWQTDMGWLQSLSRRDA